MWYRRRNYKLRYLKNHKYICCICILIVHIKDIGNYGECNNCSDAFAPCWFRWRHTFRAYLWHWGICSEPIIKEAFVPWGRPGEEVKPHGKRCLEALILLTFLNNIGSFKLNKLVRKTVFDTCHRPFFSYRLSFDALYTPI